MHQVLRAGLIVAVGVLVGCKFQHVPRRAELVGLRTGHESGRRV